MGVTRMAAGISAGALLIEKQPKRSQQSSRRKDETSRYKRRAGVREVEKCFPYFVETDVPLGGFGNRLDAMYEFHTRHGVRAINSTGRRGENGRYYVRWCFADPALAEAFASEFGST
jgi:hypothetical protein